MFITVDQLRQTDACINQVNLFQRIFSSKEVEFNKENIKAAIEGGLNLIWWLKTMVHSDNGSAESKFYQKTIDQLWQAKESQNTDTTIDLIYKTIILNVSKYHESLRASKDFQEKKQNGEIPPHQLFYKHNRQDNN